MTECPRCATPLDRLPARCPVCGGGAGVVADPGARRRVAEYLAGGVIAGAELEAAWAKVRDDAEFTAHLRTELGLGGEASPCDVFRSRAGEFAELPPPARDREAADLAEHARDCPACRRLLWQLRPLWDAGGRLTEPIRVAVAAGGRVWDRGLGPPAAPHEFAALRAGPDDANPVPLEWSLAVPDPPTTLRVRVSAGPGGEPRVAVRAEGASGTAEFATPNGSAYFAGALDEIPPGGLPVPPGRWVCEVRLPAAGGERAWRFDLDLTTGDA